MPSSDVLVIGGGVIGLSVAHECARRGASVTLLSDGAPGASLAAAGMLCPAFEAMQTGGRALAGMGLASLGLWDAYAARLGDAGTLGYERRGTVGVGYPPRALPGTPAPVPAGIEAGGAVLVAGEGQVDPRRLAGALARACGASGVRAARGRAARLTAEGARVTGAELAGGEVLSANATVAATGAGALVPGVRLTGVRGRAFLVRNTLGLDRVVRSPSVYLAPKPDGLLYVGATEEEAGASRDGPAAPDGLWSEACWLAPSLRGAGVLARFDGVRPRTEDELPMIGPHGALTGPVLALGHHRNGVLLAPLTAARAADAALGRA